MTLAGERMESESVLEEEEEEDGEAVEDREGNKRELISNGRSVSEPAATETFVAFAASKDDLFADEE
jgi:hypothetical protein